MNFDYSKPELEASRLIDLYKAMLKSRMIEEKMLILLRQGKISKWFSGIGQEAISTGITLAMREDEYILPMHRNLSVFTNRKIPLYRLFSQWQGKMNGFTKGRDRSFHFGTQEFKIVGMISHLGPQLGVANGIALAHKLRNEEKVTAVFSGEGATSEGDFHEALNVASVWNLPVLFCIENNGYGLSTPISEQFNCEHIADKGKGYGMESHIIDGNNIVEVYSKVAELTQSMRKDPRPVLLEFKTFRMRGHEEASGTKYVPKDLLNEWSKKDPILNFQEFLRNQSILSEKEEVEIKTKIAHEINDNLEIAFQEKEVDSTLEKELSDVYESFDNEIIEPSQKTSRIRLVDAVSKGLYQSMERHPELVIMGQDIASYGGVFKITEGFVKKFGLERVRNTPICESSIIEAAFGLSVSGIKSVVELQFGDFISSGFNPVVNLLAKSFYRWGQNSDIVLRMPCGAGVGAGPFHSQTNEAWFTKTPGLKVVYPAFPADAKGLLASAIEDPNPVMFFEHKQLYRSVYQEVSEDFYTIPLGKASLIQEGEDVSVITYGAGVHWAIESLKKLELNADLVDLRSLQPLDIQTIYKSVKKTGKVIILQEDSLFGGIASDISALISENCFEFLDAPVVRVASPEMPIPFAKNLEAIYLPNQRFESALTELLNY
ncbi:alpha-ketoacid dehydrogenase subunit alpha/beta [Lutimonas zeaxanthinifaciens]|uniref:alpha-ketoacid dehydrogenase subunit alpha/beta n=1 Tax=Lutimonas zeaxanthinifaciens TaxID=3060215 RepID=UPI00265CBB3D|nr:dehydrogenase E1 component subunit alpha/beta [Lutimonas sp. YSD2104]WKK64566.1 dehydrogenase E1 component subunit alpha/beta [Lutimonas sp. YSD2104]